MQSFHPLVPKLFTVFRARYSRKQFFQDLTAGTIVGIVALPLAIPFAIAIAWGVKPEQGLFTAVIAGLVVAAFGGSRVQIAGPTGAFIVIVYGIIRTYGYDGLAVATLIAGVILIAMGLARLGTLLKFVPYPLTVGFTSGIALIIFSSQINDFFGLRIADLPADFVGKWTVYANHRGSVDITSLAVGVASLGRSKISLQGWRGAARGSSCPASTSRLSLRSHRRDCSTESAKITSAGLWRRLSSGREPSRIRR